MERYESYKDSGVAWIGKVPEHWEVMKTSLLYTNIGSGTTPSTSKQEYYEDDGFCWLQTGDLNDGYITDTSKKISKVAIKDCKLRFYPVGSIVIAMYGATIGKIGLLKVPTSTNQACCVLPYSNKMNEIYTFYVCQIAKGQMLLEAVGGGQPNISQDIIKKLKLPVPPICEQQAIAAYLDKRCSEIDKAIATQQKRIALLQELKQSIITHAVTRGIHPDVPLKESGVEWIGKVPEHWNVMKMNQVCNVITDYVASGSFAALKKNVTYLDSPDFAMLIRTADLSNKNKDIPRVYVSKRSYRFLSNSNLFGGEIILPNVGSVGDVYVVPDDFYDKMTLGPNAVMVKTKYNNLYYYYYFSSIRGRNSLELLGFASVQGKFNKTELRQLKVPVPSIIEQNEIVSYIEGRTKHIDLLVTKVQQRIVLLQELKQSIIIEAITGKIKVC